MTLIAKDMTPVYKATIATAGAGDRLINLGSGFTSATPQRPQH
jgi:hypothetical protein